MNFKIEWIDDYREPKCAPDPRFPKGKDLDISHDAEAACKTDLPYPAKRCGLLIVECQTCKQRIAITTAGRTDDPRSLKLACIKPEITQ